MGPKRTFFRDGVWPKTQEIWEGSRWRRSARDIRKGTKGPGQAGGTGVEQGTVEILLRCGKVDDLNETVFPEKSTATK